MLSSIITSIKVFFILSLLLGIIYPIFITIIGQLTMNNKANGSLITINNKIRGSTLIAQEFKDPKYFHSRPSAVQYNAANSGASNLGPSNPQLFENTKKQIEQIRLENNLPPHTSIPPDSVLQSASGLDPHISIKYAQLQINRISKARNISQEAISQLINENTHSNKYINVLKLNLSLDNYKE